MFTAIHGFFNLRNVSIHNDLPIDRHADFAAIRHDFLAVPLSRRFRRTTLDRNDSVNGTTELIRLQAFVLFCVIIQNLKFHSMIRRIFSWLATNADAIISTLWNTKFQPQNKILIIFWEIEETTRIAGQNPIFGRVAVGVSPLTFQIFSVENLDKTFFLLRLRQGRRFHHQGTQYSHQKTSLFLHRSSSTSFCARSLPITFPAVPSQCSVSPHR